MFVLRYIKIYSTMLFYVILFLFILCFDMFLCYMIFVCYLLFLGLECYIIVYKLCVVCLCCLTLDLYIILDYLMLSFDFILLMCYLFCFLSCVFYPIKSNQHAHFHLVRGCELPGQTKKYEIFAFRQGLQAPCYFQQTFQQIECPSN